MRIEFLASVRCKCLTHWGKNYQGVLSQFQVLIYGLDVIYAYDGFYVSALKFREQIVIDTVRTLE